MRIQMLEMLETLPEKVRDGFTQIKNQLNRVVKITRDLSQFSRITKRARIRKDINEVAGEILNLLNPQLKFEQIVLETEFQSGLPKLIMEPDRIEQVILNLVNNAVDALEGRENKALRVRTELIGKENGEYVRLAVSDNGKVIPPGDINILFDPFFTTKEAGKGTGLGLYICYNIIQENGGRIWAENNVRGGGASFFIELPVTVGEQAGEERQ
jgi:two-component system NtrC family sensor kinase